MYNDNDSGGGGGCLGLLIIYAIFSGLASILEVLLPIVFIALPVLLLIRLLVWASNDSKKKKFEMERAQEQRRIEEREKAERERAKAEEEQRRRELEALREKRRILEQIESFERTHTEARVTTVPQTYPPKAETYPPSEPAYQPSDEPGRSTVITLKSAPASGQDIRTARAEIFKSGDMYCVTFPEFGVSGTGCATREATEAFAKDMLAEVIIAREKHGTAVGNMSSGSAVNTPAEAGDVFTTNVSVDLTEYLTDLLRDGLVRFDEQGSGSDPDSQETKVRQDYVDSLRSFYEFTDNPDLKAKVRRLESEMIDVFRKTGDDPSSADKARKFFTYYLPTISSVLEKCKSMESLDLKGESMKRIVNDTHDLLNIANTAVSKLKESLFEKDLIDSSVNVDVLKTMLKQDGLIE